MRERPAVLSPDARARMERVGPRLGPKPSAEHAVLYEDDDVCVADKPAGIVTEPDLAGRVASAAGLPRVWIVQRLDRMTSGVLVLAKSAEANRVLSARIQRHDFERLYQAIVVGWFPETLELLDAPLRGRRAETRVRVLERFGRLATLLSCELSTGRTHQIRLHASRAGYAILGDPRHGQRTHWEPPRMALHAARLAFEHPRTGVMMAFDSALPADLEAFLTELRAVARDYPGPGSR